MWRRVKAANDQLDRVMLGDKPYRGTVGVVRAWVTTAALILFGIIVFDLFFYGEIRSWTEALLYPAFFAAFLTLVEWYRRRRSNAPRSTA